MTLIASVQPEGVMNAEYARQRESKPALGFRLRTRARLVVNAVRRYLGSEIGRASCRERV